MVPTCVVDEAIDVIAFPDPNESFKMSNRTIEDTMVVAPAVQTLLGGGTLGTYTHKELKDVPVHLHLEKYTEHRDKDVEIQWQFKNDGSRYFPSTIRLLVVVTKQSASSFPFTLRILHTLKLRLGPTKWRFWSRVITPLRNQSGRSWSIDKDHNPGVAKEAFDECQMASLEGKFSQKVGLSSALDSYLKKG